MAHANLYVYILYKRLLRYKCSYYIYTYVAHCDFRIVCLEHIQCITYIIYIFKSPQSQGNEKQNLCI